MDFILLLISLITIIISYFVAIELKYAIHLDKKCFADCWFGSCSKFHKFFSNPNGIILNTIATISAIILVMLIMLNLLTIIFSFDLKTISALFVSITITYLIYTIKFKKESNKQSEPTNIDGDSLNGKENLKEERLPIYFKIISSFFGSIIGLIFLLTVIVFNTPDYNIALDPLKNSSEMMQNYTYLKDSILIYKYLEFDSMISSFMWFGMLKISEELHHWSVLIIWFFFVFLKMGFFTSFSIIFLTLREKLNNQSKIILTDYSKDCKANDKKSNKIIESIKNFLCGNKCLLKLHVLVSLICLFGLLKIESEINLKNNIYTNNNYITADESLKLLEPVYADLNNRTKNIINDINLTKIVEKNYDYTGLLTEKIEAVNTKVKSSLEEKFQAKLKEYKVQMNEQIKHKIIPNAQAELGKFKKEYSLNNQDQKKIVYDYIFSNTNNIKIIQESLTY